MFRRAVPILIILVFALSAQGNALEPVRWTGSFQEIVPKVPRIESKASSSRAQPTAHVKRPANSKTHGAHPSEKAFNVAAKTPPTPRLAAKRSQNVDVIPEVRHALGLPDIDLASRLVRVSAPADEKPVARPAGPKKAHPVPAGLRVKAKALFCLDCASNKVLLAKNVSEPLPIASITKLLTAMVVVDEMNLDQVVEVPSEVLQIPPHKVGIRPGDRISVRDLLHGMLIESGNDCAEVLARAYPKGGKAGFMATMNRKAARLGASCTKLYTPSGLDLKLILGKKEGQILEATRPNVASAKDVALIARVAFKYPLIAEITSTKRYTITTRNTKPRKYLLASNIKLLYGKLPVVGAKTGFTNMAGRCIVARFKHEAKDHMVVLLNTPRHFRAAEKVYRWVSEHF